MRFHLFNIVLFCHITIRREMLSFAILLSGYQFTSTLPYGCVFFFGHILQEIIIDVIDIFYEYIDKAYH